MTYTPLRSNEALAMRVFQVTDGEPFRRGWYIRLWVDYPDSDLLLTFGPVGRKRAQSLQDLLTETYCDVRENWEGPFERDKEEARLQAQAQEVNAPER